MPEIL